MSACDRCLRRAEFLGRLAPRIADLVVGPRERAQSLLALSNAELARAVAPNAAAEILRDLKTFKPASMRAQMATAKLTAICRHDASYPPRLRDLSDAPHVLFVRGHADALAELSNTPSVAVVGARRASSYALEEARGMGRALAAAEVPVVSGLALGIDAAAHRGALAGGGRPVAVLASGADVPYPRQHRGIYAQIVEAGAVISEMPPGTTARRWAFPARNRIMAGLAKMVLVVEAAEQSGTLITASFAAQLGREIGAIPGRVNARGAAGSNRLLLDGAAVILGVQDVLDRLFYVGARRVSTPPIELAGPERAVLDQVEAGESPLAAAGVDVRRVRAALGRLEVLGLVKRDGLGGYERTGLRCAAA